QGLSPGRATSSEPKARPGGIAAGRTFPGPLVDVARKPSSHHRGDSGCKGRQENPSETHEEGRLAKINQNVKMRAGSLAASAAGREAMPGTVPGDWDSKLRILDAILDESLKILEDAKAEPVGKGDLASQPTFRIEPLGDGQVRHQKAGQKDVFPQGSRGRLAAPAAGRKAMPDTGLGTGGAAGPTARVPDSQKGPGKGFCKGAGCWLGLMAGLLFLELIVILCCVQIWNWWKRKQSTSAASQDRPKTSLWDNWTCHLASPCPCPLSLPRLHFQLIAGDSRLPPPPIAGPWLPKGAGPGVQPGQEVQPSCQGR
ncbi:unnamed protein product, partial [Coccothraustes coccothraustes]